MGRLKLTAGRINRRCKKLRKFQEEETTGRTSSSFWERFKFFKRQKDRDTCLKNLNTWNKRMKLVIDAAAGSRKALSTNRNQHNAPSSQLRTLSRKLFTALSKCWSCDCTSQHDAKFCLSSCGGSRRDPDEYGIYFDFLVGRSQCQEAPKWHEGTVTIKAAK